jgi:hypothetical protein
MRKRRFLKSLLQTGISLLDQPDRAAEALREELGRRFRREDHTIRYVMVFAAGVGVGLGIGVLRAPASGVESRSAIANKVRKVSDRTKTQISGEGNFASGT